jgi:hypothetical protein
VAVLLGDLAGGDVLWVRLSAASALATWALLARPWYLLPSDRVSVAVLDLVGTSFAAWSK